ncbi:MAG: hypothetical protein HY537_16060 [Deltaproteobacteria bacterium]|nr:hypothetical protein [Deltaproteobacteria bacterium]
MRESVIALIVLAGILTAVIKLNHNGNLLPNVGSPAQMAVPSKQDSDLKKKGVTHERANQRTHFKAQNTREETVAAESAGGDASPFGESQNLPSIYESEAFTVSAAEKENSATGQQAKGKKVLHGVPLEAWVLSQKNAIAWPVSADESQLRLFLGCMEWKKKGLSPVEPRECRALTHKESAELAISGIRRANPNH